MKTFTLNIFGLKQSVNRDIQGELFPQSMKRFFVVMKSLRIILPMFCPLWKNLIGNTWTSMHQSSHIVSWHFGEEFEDVRDMNL
ncbi:hypothetical protein SADUNF_Sadunf13G0059400 [Salix dunnii]|uniref:Uncharacterized protein n=1 Tax=Salix dunnii TaxID=1413687 RepID=A0A835JFP6_9ROSI|nr:hypothetical protein SADUNF_Sadunf13G0059400 [Salix dunnii]